LNYKKLKEAYPIWSSMMSHGKPPQNFAKLLSNTDTPVNPFVELAKSLTGLQSNHTLPAIGLALVERMPVRNVDFYLDMGKKLTAELSETLGDDGVLIFPSFPITAPYHNQPLWTNTFDFIYFGIINALGFPSTQCPLGLSPSDGLPTGVQIIANHRMDHLTIRLAEYFEANSLAGWVQPF
jgi:fatty acid amide hydrolase 2